MNTTDVNTAHASKLRVLIADDSTASRQKLRRALAGLPHVEIVGEAEHDKEALNLFLYTRPNAVVAAICMPERGGFHILRCIKRAAADCAVILTLRTPDPWVEEAAGVLGAAGICNAAEEFVQLPGILERFRNGK